MTATAATRSTITDIQKSSRLRIAAIRAQADAAVEAEHAFAADLIAEAIKADFLAGLAQAEWLAINGPDAEPVERRSYEPTSVLPTGARMNPAQPESAVYYDDDQTAYILRTEGTGRPTRVVTSFGSLRGWNVGSIQTLRHDQTWATLGTVEVIGVVEYKTGLSVGDVPSRSLAHSVMK